MLDPFLVLKIPLMETSLAALVSFIMCSSHVSSPPAGAMACLGLYLFRSRPWAWRQCSSGRRRRPSGRARATAVQRILARRNFMLIDLSCQVECLAQHLLLLLYPQPYLL